MKSYQIYSNLAKIWAKFAKNLEFFFLKSKNELPKSCLNQTFYVLKQWNSFLIWKTALNRKCLNQKFIVLKSNSLHIFSFKTKEQKIYIFGFLQKVRRISWAIAYSNLPPDNCLGPNKRCQFWDEIVYGRPPSLILSRQSRVGRIFLNSRLLELVSTARVGSCVSSPFSRCTPILDRSE